MTDLKPPLDEWEALRDFRHALRTIEDSLVQTQERLSLLQSSVKVIGESMDEELLGRRYQGRYVLAKKWAEKCGVSEGTFRS